MKAKRYHLAQINIARMKAPLNDPIMAGFVAQLDQINALADDSSGFIWRLKTEAGDATALRVFADERILINISVWESVEALHKYTYRSGHAALLRQRLHWFEILNTLHMALWWIPAGHKPTPDEGKERLELLRREGPSPAAFFFKQQFPPPDEPLA